MNNNCAPARWPLVWGEEKDEPVNIQCGVVVLTKIENDQIK